MYLRSYVITQFIVCQYIFIILQNVFIFIQKKPSPVGEGGTRSVTDEELEILRRLIHLVACHKATLFAYAVPLPPLGKAIQFYR